MKKLVLLGLLSLCCAAGADEPLYRRELSFGYYPAKAEAVVAAAEFSALVKELLVIEDLRFEAEGELFFVTAACIGAEENPQILYELEKKMGEKAAAAGCRAYTALSPPEKVVAKGGQLLDRLECAPVSLSLPLGARRQNWRVGAKKIFKGGIASADCMPGDATEKSWSEKVNIRFQPYENVRSPLVTARKLGELFLRELGHEFGGRAEYKIYKKSHGEFIIEWKLLEEVNGMGPLHEILRILTDKSGVCRLSYISKRVMEEEQRDRWLEAISGAVKR